MKKLFKDLLYGFRFASFWAILITSTIIVQFLSDSFWYKFFAITWLVLVAMVTGLFLKRSS